jgi:hypothetical protein
MTIRIYTQPPQPWDDACERAEIAGYILKHVGSDKPFGVLKNGELLAQFGNPVDRDKWLHETLEEMPRSL